MYEGQLPPDNSKIHKKVTRLLYIAALIATFNCIVRNDYNLHMALLAIFVVNRYMMNKAFLIFKLIYWGLILFSVFDIIWLIIIMKPWLFQTPSNGVYERAKFWRVVVYLASIGGVVVKVMLMMIFGKINDVERYQSLNDVENDI